MADLHALDVFLDGLSSRNPELRGQARASLKKLRVEARQSIEGRFNTFPLAVQSELQTLYKEIPEALKGPIFQGSAKALSLEDFLQAALVVGGDPVRGRKLFADSSGVNCIGCHRVANDGGDVGPDLSGIGTQSDRRALAESVLYPSKVVREGYQRTVIELKDGDELSGLVKSETTDSITLRDAAGQLVVVRKADIRERRQTADSMMPEGLQSGLSPEEFRDLVAYLASLRGDPKNSK
jgi:putative heme-binding domain-containing protein